MALGDIQVLRVDNGHGQSGAVSANVAAGATAILSGEPVSKALGATTAIAAATATPVVGTDFYVGVAESSSTQTASVAGSVTCVPCTTDVTFLIAPAAPTSWDTQAEYDALVGKRVVLQLSGGVYTILATDSANNGCVVQPLDISKTPGKVAFKFRAAVNYMS